MIDGRGCRSRREFYSQVTLYRDCANQYPEDVAINTLSKTTTTTTGVGQFLVKVVAVPGVVRRQVLGSPWCANATDHGGFRRAADHGGNHGGDSAGDKVVDVPVVCNDRCRVVQGAENCEGPAVAAHLTRGSMSLLSQFIDGSDVPVIMQRRLRQWKCLRFRSSPESRGQSS